MATEPKSSNSNAIQADIESYDLVIVGAGIHGLSMAKTYLTVSPSSSVLILDKGTTIGGVWARDRLYPGLKTNNHFGTFEFSDFPMVAPELGEDDHIPGEVMHSYLHAYAEKFELLPMIRFQCTVTDAKDEGNEGWLLTVHNSLQEKTESIKAQRMVVATGLTSEPFVPTFNGQSTFSAPIFHSSEFAKASHGGLGTYKKVVVLSGAKFSWDIAMAYASAGIPVEWVIRASGHGPCWMAPPRITPLKLIPEKSVQTRFVTWLSPCVWGDHNDGYAWIRAFLHRTWLGQKIVKGFFGLVEHGILEHNQYEKHPETEKLRPWDEGVFFVGTNRGLLNYDADFFELVRNGTIKVHIADITHLSTNTVHLSDGKAMEADVLICGTGWKDTPPINFTTTKELGLPGSSHPPAGSYIARAEQEILENCPSLAAQPPERKSYKPMTDKQEMTKPEPYRLYRFIVPPAFISNRTLAFAGAYRSPSVSIINQAQALWITAFFTSAIPSLSSSDSAPSSTTPLLDDPSHTSDLQDQIAYSTILHSEFCKWRYSKGFGARFPDLWFDSLPYVDFLLADLGVRTKRKSVPWWSWQREWLRPYLPGDYVGIVEEWMEKSQIRSPDRGVDQ